MKIEKDIYPIHNYPTDGNHMECYIGLDCFEIRKGEDPYWYTDKKGKECGYNIYKTKLDTKWIVNIIEEEACPSLMNIFEVKVNKDLDKIINYCIKIYKKSLKMELIRIMREIDKYEEM